MKINPKIFVEVSEIMSDYKNSHLEYFAYEALDWLVTQPEEVRKKACARCHPDLASYIESCVPRSKSEIPFNFEEAMSEDIRKNDELFPYDWRWDIGDIAREYTKYRLASLLNKYGLEVDTKDILNDLSDFYDHLKSYDA